MGISGISPLSLLLILLIVVLLFGSKRIGQLGQDLGQAFSGFKKGLDNTADKKQDNSET